MAKLSRHARKEQGDAAEARFRAWLDRCVLPHMYVEQSPLTVPKGLRGEIKRPDFLVGLPTIGTLAFDVKAKSIYDDYILIDAYEHRTFRNFETFSTSLSGMCASRPPSRTSATCSSTATSKASPPSGRAVRCWPCR